jgi:hypothetical protein
VSPAAFGAAVDSLGSERSTVISVLGNQETTETISVAWYSTCRPFSSMKHEVRRVPAGIGLPPTRRRRR